MKLWVNRFNFTRIQWLLSEQSCHNINSCQHLCYYVTVNDEKLVPVCLHRSSSLQWFTRSPRRKQVCSITFNVKRKCRRSTTFNMKAGVEAFDPKVLYYSTYRKTRWPMIFFTIWTMHLCCIKWDLRNDQILDSFGGSW